MPYFGVQCLVILLISVISCQSYRYVNPYVCRYTPTTVSGTKAPTGRICKGQLLLDERFVDFDRDLWKHEVTLGGGGNWEFQWYVDDPKNSFVKDGKLVLRPTLTSVEIGETALESALVKLNPCTNNQWFGCERQGTKTNIINPVRSARLNTAGSFSFKYGRIEVIAKLPIGDWLWPAVWLLPTDRVYGDWPRSGEIDLIEARGNREYRNGEGKHIGVEHFGSTLHFGPRWDQNAYWAATFSTRSPPGQGFNNGFHRFLMEWSPHCITFCIDGREIGRVPVNDGMWARGKFTGENIWANGTKMAPFDQEFHIILNLAVGGTNGYFPDEGNASRKPWLNSSPQAATDFWKGRNQWLPGWNLDKPNSTDASLIIDSIRVWAL
ncbi:beta-1,3-glucan-binding protein-like [Sitodiplosis mosellana]|uniref:beta-1,3-glucan-binding protein-like n=1 Tax=Sitodiplosis mosellana TaxID=263140 RepID=UPI002444C888|nr:beta-1,3-glucan-binding protein-like [Sitodiplosis mosellana]